MPIARADLRDGMLLLNQRRMPLDFSADDITAAMTYNHVARRYDGSVQVGKMDAKYQDFRDVRRRPKCNSASGTTRPRSRISSSRLRARHFRQAARSRTSIIRRCSLPTAARSALLSSVPSRAYYQLRGGTMLLDGSATYSEAAGYASRGRIAVRDIDYLDNGIALRKANLNSNFSLDNNHLSLTRIAARLLGGQITGDADVKNLVPATSAPTDNRSRRISWLTAGKPASNQRSGNHRRISQTNNPNVPTPRKVRRGCA